LNTASADLLITNAAFELIQSIDQALSFALPVCKAMATRLTKSRVLLEISIGLIQPPKRVDDL
jgi:hypothetical protein